MKPGLCGLYCSCLIITIPSPRGVLVLQMAMKLFVKCEILYKQIVNHKKLNYISYKKNVKITKIYMDFFCKNEFLIFCFFMKIFWPSKESQCLVVFDFIMQILCIWYYNLYFCSDVHLCILFNTVIDSTQFILQYHDQLTQPFQHVFNTDTLLRHTDTLLHCKLIWWTKCCLMSVTITC